jgi:membrane-bound lytic murein transglycosylase D
MSAIENEFDKQSVPRELARIAFVESSFNLKAHSKVGASGVYQIMPSTGRQYLKTYPGIDERNDPIKAARAAAKLLKLNYKITKKWPLAITAYNHGVGSIRRAVKTTGSSDIEVIIEKYRHKSFGFASKNFFTEYLAILGTLHNAHNLFPGINRHDPISFDNVKLPRTYTISQIKKKYKITSTQIKDLNPDISHKLLRSNGTISRGYILKIPVRSKSLTSVKTKKNTAS